VEKLDLSDGWLAACLVVIIQTETHFMAITHM